MDPRVKPSFYDEVIKTSSVFHSKYRCFNLTLLHPTMRRKVVAICEDAHAHGIELQIFETYRSSERQLELFKEGATKLKTVGVHHYGLAADIVFTDVGGGPSWKGNFDLIGHLARAHNLIWGGDWGEPNQHHSFIDSDHVQWCSLKDQTKLFAGTWYPDDDYDPT